MSVRPLYIYFFEVIIIILDRPLYIYFFEVVIFFCETVVRGPDLFFRGDNNFRRDGGERARPLIIYFFEVVIILGVTVVRGPDLFFRGHNNFRQARRWWEGLTTLHLFFRGRNNYFWWDETTFFIFVCLNFQDLVHIIFKWVPDHSTFIFSRS